MLQRLLSYDDELYGDGLWSRDQLLAMDSSFTAAVETAFRLGLESRTAASATVRVGYRNGREAAIEGAIQAGWNWFRSNEDVDIPFAAVVAFVQARCSGATPARVRAGFERRFKGERRRSAATTAA